MFHFGDFEWKNFKISFSARPFLPPSDEIDGELISDCSRVAIISPSVVGRVGVGIRENCNGNCKIEMIHSLFGLRATADRVGGNLTQHHRIKIGIIFKIKENLLVKCSMGTHSAVWRGICPKWRREELEQLMGNYNFLKITVYPHHEIHYHTKHSLKCLESCQQ